MGLKNGNKMLNMISVKLHGGEALDGILINNHIFQYAENIKNNDMYT